MSGEKRVVRREWTVGPRRLDDVLVLDQRVLGQVHADGPLGALLPVHGHRLRHVPVAEQLVAAHDAQVLAEVGVLAPRVLIVVVE